MSNPTADGATDPFDLDRFVRAQDAGGSYDGAVAELRRGRKASHWMWYVFPQLAGLGQSSMSRHFAIASLAEARAYLAHSLLGLRLRETTGLVAGTHNTTAVTIFGTVDAQKLCSSMTLFSRAAPDEPLFAAVLESFFAGSPDPATDRLLGLGGAR